MLIENNESPEIKMGIGMIMPEVVDVFPFGHMWIYWTKSEDEYYPAYRGYYPVTNDIPPIIRDNRIKMLRFFTRKSVRGFYTVDRNAIIVTNNFFEQIFRKEWGITTEQLERLKNRCNLPKGIDYKVEGLYSWNKKQPDWNNCSSWAIKIVYNVMNDPNFLICSSPKQFSVVKEEIEWDYVPAKENGG